MGWDFGLLKGLVKAGGEVAVDGIKTVNGSQAEQDQQSADIKTAGLAQFSKEFETAGDGWFDSLMNGINRIPRPFGFFAVFGFMGWVAVDPVGALLFAQNMAALPVWFQVMISGIIGFFYGMRHVEKHFSRRYRKADQKAITAAIANNAHTGASRSEPPLTATPHPEGQESATKPPLSAKIEAFNKRVRERFARDQAKDR